MKHTTTVKAILFSLEKHATFDAFIKSEDFNKTLDNLPNVQGFIYRDAYQDTITDYVNSLYANLALLYNPIEIGFISNDVKTLTFKQLEKNCNTLINLAQHNLIGRINVKIHESGRLIFDASESPNPNHIVLDTNNYSARLIEELASHTALSEDKLKSSLEIEIHYYQLLSADKTDEDWRNLLELSPLQGFSLEES
ncbi:hypothetical protein [Vibrio alginolyticus]|uniref:hypothetical protein n=1 Tax=Vibrio TaxID=662 RepID=UPI0006CA6040|nr:hypothetical protein [Vibrio alginolyticus]KPM97641.1 hypothetical protein AOG25_14360 [Vibrio alginolyticus]